jgi:hypothetical protein
VPLINLDRFDPDVHPAISVSHNPPFIARTDDIVKIEFDFVCAYAYEAPGLNCGLDATLFISFGGGEEFSPVPLIKENQDGLRVWSAHIWASDEEGQPLRYYLQVNDPQAKLEVRYPIEGAIDLFVVSEFIPIDLPAQKQAELGELVRSLPWGSGCEAVGLRDRGGYPSREGTLAMDLGEDGRIALLDHVNGRVLLFDPMIKSYTNIPLLFTLRSSDDVQFDWNGQLVVFDPVGASIDPSKAHISQLYRLLPDGRIEAVAPVFVNIPAWLTKELKVIDLAYSKLVAPFSPSGEVNSREAQRQKQPLELLAKYMIHTVHEVRFDDTQKGIAFAVRSVSPLGAITYFEKTPQGYIAVFEGDQIRAIWFDAAGIVLKDITMTRDEYSEISVFGHTAINPSGSLYVMGTTVRGVEVRFVAAL